MITYNRINTAIIFIVFVLLVLLAPAVSRMDQRNNIKQGLVETCTVTTDVTCYTTNPTKEERYED